VASPAATADEKRARQHSAATAGRSAPSASRVVIAARALGAEGAALEQLEDPVITDYDGVRDPGRGYYAGMAAPQVALLKIERPTCDAPVDTAGAPDG